MQQAAARGLLLLLMRKRTFSHKACFPPPLPFLSTITLPTSSFLPLLGPMSSDSTAKPIVTGHGSNAYRMAYRHMDTKVANVVSTSIYCCSSASQRFLTKAVFPPLPLALSFCFSARSPPILRCLWLTIWLGVGPTSRTVDCACPVGSAPILHT